MRGATAKRIRREVYGDMAIRGHDYRVVGRGRLIRFFDTKRSFWRSGTIVAEGLRRQYQAVKKAVRENGRGNGRG